MTGPIGPGFFIFFQYDEGMSGGSSGKNTEYVPQTNKAKELLDKNLKEIIGDEVIEEIFDKAKKELKKSNDIQPIINITTKTLNKKLPKEKRKELKEEELDDLFMVLLFLILSDI